MKIFSRKTQKLNCDLYWAIVNDDLPRVRDLIVNGAKPNAVLVPVSRNEVPLHVAIRYGNRAIVHYLLNAGADPREPFKIGPYEFTQSETAAAWNFDELAKFLKIKELEAEQQHGPRRLLRPPHCKPPHDPPHLAP